MSLKLYIQAFFYGHSFLGPVPGLTRGLTNEGFVRSGSGRKLPQIPERSRSNTLPTRKPSEGDEGDEESSFEVGPNGDSNGGKNNKSKPKALEFWESMENLERNDFRYNTIHRMSVGRRMLPKPPSTSDGSHSRHVIFYSLKTYTLGVFAYFHEIYNFKSRYLSL